MDGFPLHDLSDRILRCAVAVHKELGPGLPEYSYQTALALERDAEHISYLSEQPLAVRYRGIVVGWLRPDFIVERNPPFRVVTSVSMFPCFGVSVLVVI